MFRIVGGIHRSRKINRVELESTRETADNVREAVFNLIGQQLNGVSLDLFAGSGAYGLEAISRGSSFCYLFDINKKAVSTIISNATLLKETQKVLIKLLEYKSAISYLKENNIMVDYIFLDPPYNYNISDIILDVFDILNEKGIIIAEMDRKTELMNCNSLEVLKTRIYGIKKIVILSK